jgi:hypothetical protein
MAFVLTSKFPPMVIYTGKCEKFAGVNFTILVFSWEKRDHIPYANPPPSHLPCHSLLHN